ncbi:MAG TPA: hypothetical protein PK836_07115 [Syntrophales bacterium]|nr:hypothetical protein [Syntrophales bacterium]HOM07517.1 hypothetical protein [Syntrophales bacterium]HON99844.1 hypothetical protein [Syntrophales bacterium]HPC01439.1 hypothetical protein [Syntrophales bacterium]HPQ07138.1 hypothetical protein [Syntrophales bacterium]
MTLYEKIPLPNGLTLEIWDASRKIAEDTTKVEMVARIEVVFRPEHFLQEEHFAKTVSTLGPSDFYEYRKERTFVRNEDREAVFRELLGSFKEDVLPYLRRDDFPGRFSRSRHRYIEQHWYRFLPPQEDTDDE